MQQIVAQFLHPLGVGRVVLQTVDQALYGAVEGLAQTVAGVLGHVLQQAVQSAGNQARALVAEPVGWQHFFLDRVLALEPDHDGLRDQHMGLVLAQHAADARQHIVEHLLVAPARSQPRQQRSGRARQIHMLHHGLERLGQKLLYLLVLHHLQRGQRQPRHLPAQQLAVGWGRQPVGQRLGRVVALDQRHQRGRVEKLVAHESGQVAPYAILVARDDGRVPPHQRQRNMAKQRRDRKPVGQCPHHGSLADGPQTHQPQRHGLALQSPARARQRRGDEAGRHQQQQNQRQPLGALQGQALFFGEHGASIGESSRLAYAHGPDGSAWPALHHCDSRRQAFAIAPKIALLYCLTLEKS